MSSHATPATCPHCSYEIDASTGVFQDEAIKPSEGSVSICLNCGKLSVFTKNLKLRKPTAAEFALFSSDPRIIQAQIVRTGVMAEKGRS
jgi:hypothetical protein